MKIKEIMEKHKDKLSDDFIIETDFSSNVTVYTADLLITDWSAIAFEFAFTTNKPALFINTEMKVVNRDYKQIPLIPFDITTREKLGRSLNKDQVKNAHEVVADLLTNQKNYEERIDRIKHEYFYNLGNSGEVGADYIIRRIKAKNTARETVNK
ncbi:MAG: CDP-glycerol glycerophosphotransferase family protein [Clostridia bacterium]|nr:CDP-glycerol glycerophosphotransferase family protein [Clostridia bacterium]